MNRKRITAFILGFAVIAMASACATGTIKLKHSRYAAAFNADEFKEYKGTSIYLFPFANKADNATFWYYTSYDNRTQYVMGSIEQFFWNCCKDAFIHAGILVYESNYPVQSVNTEEKVKQGLKEFRLQLSSMTDREYRFIVTLFEKGTIIYQRKFIIPMEAPDTEDKNRLEERAYRMIDKSFTTILKDRGFKDAFFREAAAAPDAPAASVAPAAAEPVKGEQK